MYPAPSIKSRMDPFSDFWMSVECDECKEVVSDDAATLRNGSYVCRACEDAEGDRITEEDE